MKNIIDILKGFFLIMKDKLRDIRDHKYTRFYPTNPRHDDVYIVEFPKSGITWLSTMIANVNLLESNEKSKVTFFNVHQYIADIHTSKDLHNEPLWIFPRFRFIKSHDVYNKNYNFVIYLIRDPYKVMNSYFNFAKKLGSFNGTFEEFVKHPRYGIKSWLKHVSSWLDKGVTLQRIHLIKYEDLIKQPYVEINKVYQNLGLSINENLLKKAIERSDIANMKNSEEMNNSNNPNNNEFQFVGSGQMSFNSVMSDEAKNYINKNIKSNKIYKNLYLD